MDLSTNDVLFVLGAIELAACVGCALYWLMGRGSEARPARRGTGSGRSAVRRRAAREKQGSPPVRSGTGAAAGGVGAATRAFRPTTHAEQAAIRIPGTAADAEQAGIRHLGTAADTEFPSHPGAPAEWAAAPGRYEELIASPRGDRARPSPRRERTAGPAFSAGQTASRHPDVHAGQVSEPAPDERNDVSDSGRHHVPDELLQASTYRLSADRRARARVPGAAGGLSIQIPGQGRPPADDRRGAASDDVPLHT